MESQIYFSITNKIIQSQINFTIYNYKKLGQISNIQVIITEICMTT